MSYDDFDHDSSDGEDPIMDTQREAYEIAQENEPKIAELVLKELAKEPAGLTADEIATRVNKSPFSVRPTVCNLFKADVLYDTGHRRPNRSGRNAAVWAVA